MPIDFAAGLSAMGESVAKTASAWTLEAQRADLHKEAMVLADEMAGKREEKGREFQKGEREATQDFTKGENVENRKSAKELAILQSETAIKTAGISAGATMGAAQLSAQTSRLNNADTIKAHAEDTDKKLKANQPLLDTEVLAKQIKNTSDTMVQDARKELIDARASGDPEKIKAAQQKEYDASYTSQAQVQQASLYQTQAKLLGDAVSNLQTRLVALSDPMKTMTPEGKSLAAQLEQQLKRLQSEHATALKMAKDAMDNLPAYTQSGAKAGAPPLSSFMKQPDAPTSMINPSPAGARPY